MKVKLFYAFLIINFIFINNLYAMGIGFYVNAYFGKAKWRYEKDYVENYTIIDNNNRIYDISNNYYRSLGINSAYGGGLVFDSNLEGLKIINYRLNIGINNFKSYGKHKINILRSDCINSLGFRIYEVDYLKLWIGTQVGLHYLWGKDGSTTYESIIYDNGVTQIQLPDKYKRKYSMFGISIGPVLGLNFNINKHITVSVDSGISGTVTIKLKQKEYYNSPDGLFDIEYFIRFGTLFRIN